MKRLLLGLLLVNFSVWAAHDKIECRRAQESDIPSIIDLMKEAARYGDRMVIVPEVYRRTFIKELIDENVLFVAVVNDGTPNKVVVGTKKFFVAEGTEKQHILDLLRSDSKKDALSLKAKVGDKGGITEDQTMSEIRDLGVCLYTGFSYTREAFREHNVHKKLSEFAYTQILQQIKDILSKTTGPKRITFLVGLTHVNTQGVQQGGAYNRVPSLAKGFQGFIKQYFDKGATIVNLDLFQYVIVMPKFDEILTTSEKLVPLPESEFIPAFGYVLTYELKDAAV